MRKGSARRLFNSVSVAVVLLGIGGGAGVLVAQESHGARAMREKVAKKLGRAEEARDAGNFQEALKELQDIENMKDLDPYEKAQLYNVYGRVFAYQEKYEESIGAYEKVLLQENLPKALEEGTLYMLARLEIQVAVHADSAGARRGFEKTIGYLERWLASAENPSSEPFFLLGQAYYQLERYREAVDPVQRAIGIAEQRGQDPQENWYVLLRALYFEIEDYPKLLEVLEILVTRFPSKEYWIHLAAAYGEMGDTARQLAAYDVAFEQGYLETGRELLVFSQLLAQADVPHRAARLLENGLKDGAVAGTARNWRFLSQAWSLAQEDAKAIEALTTAAGLSGDGELDARLAQSYANLGDWQKTVEAARVALQKGVEDAHEVYVTLGIALFELERYEDAKDAFREAQKTPEARESAAQWIVYIEHEEKRLRELQESLE